MSFRWIVIKPDLVVLNGQAIDHQKQGNALLTELYKTRVNDYPKFHKMDTLCKLGFVASELLLQDEAIDSVRFTPCEDRAIVFFNQSGSIDTDKNYQATIQEAENYFPSPSVFVYTLSNIVCGEVAIRNKYHGEASFYLLNEINADSIAHTVNNAFQDTTTTSVLGGWVNCESSDEFQAFLFITDKNCDESSLTDQINTIIKQFNI